ncbi:MAG: HD-like signal output (HDOD) protein [Planctomycetota bacterium]
MKKRILFVDDETRVLDGLRRSLRRFRDRWDTDFAESGQAALDLLDQTTYDIVVSDMRMPGMDGFELLSIVRDKFPDTLRIVLSGQTEHDTAIRSVSISHQFLSKPCEGDLLRAVLDRACAVRSLVIDPRHRQAVSRLGCLPSAPSLYIELTEAMADDSNSATDIGMIIEKDMGMTIKIMQIVNSAYFGLSREISDIRESVSYLGLGMIRSLALAEGAFSTLKGNEAFSERDYIQEQKHGMLTASIASAISPTKELKEEAMLAGMLHDLGYLLIATLFPEDFLKHREAMALGKSGEHDETKLFGTTHGKLGAYLLGSWGLPIHVTEAVAFHHSPNSVEHSEFNTITAVHVANGLISDLQAPREFAPFRSQIDLDYLDRLDLLDQLPIWRKTAHEIINNTLEQSDD